MCVHKQIVDQDMKNKCSEIYIWLQISEISSSYEFFEWNRSASLVASLIGCDVMRQSCLQRSDWPRDTIDFSKTYRDWPMVNV